MRIETAIKNVTDLLGNVVDHIRDPEALSRHQLMALFSHFRSALTQLCGDFNSINFDSTDIPVSMVGGKEVSSKALSPVLASKCITDYRRTDTFMRGVVAAIESLIEKFPDERIKILYVTGPFAPLVLPALKMFSSDQIGVEGIDLHEESIKTLEYLVSLLDLEDYFIDTRSENALDYCPESEEDKPHMMIVETMDRGLLNEPQVALTAHLRKHLREGGIFLPEKVSVRLAVDSATRKELEYVRHEVSAAFNLSLHTEPIPDILQRTWRVTQLRELVQISALTRVQVFRDIVLGEGKSRITEEEVVWAGQLVRGVNANENIISCSYPFGASRSHTRVALRPIFGNSPLSASSVIKHRVQ